jgi:acetyltransferase-like isoleucine patch superfamily enzyme
VNDKYCNTENYQRMMRFLEDGLNLDELLATPTIYEPVVVTNGHKVEYLGSGIRIDSFVKIEGGEGVRIGRGVHVASFAHLNIGGGELHIGDYAAIASGAKIITGSNSPEGLSMSASAPREVQVVERSFNQIARYACVLTNAVVLPGVTLHEGAILGANSLANQNIPAWEIWVGSPARFVGRRKVRE